jgi:protocatechuate 3,4-dioxygenase beta subunit
MNQVSIYALVAVLLCSTMMKAQTDKTLDITVQVLDGRNGKPVADQHVLVFTGLSAAAVKTHAQHTGVTTDKDGMGTITIYPGETQWLQVFTDGRIPCFPDPNQASFSVSDIMSKRLVTPNDCSAQVQQPSPGHFVIYARPAHFMEKMKQ